MRTGSKCVLISFSLALTLSLACGQVAFAQTVQFTVDSAVLTGTVTCPDNTVVNLIPVDPVHSEFIGTNEATLNAATVTACGKTIYQATNIDDKTHADDTLIPLLDDGFGQNIARNLKFLSSVVSVDAENGSANCTGDIDNLIITCSGTADFTNLVVGGMNSAGPCQPGATINIAAQIPSQSCPGGVELFVGQLIVDDSFITNSNSSNPSIEFDWLHLRGESECRATAAITQYDLRDRVNLSVLDNNPIATVQLDELQCRFN